MVIVMRKDLNMRKGKMVAQGCHAAIGAVHDSKHRDQRNLIEWGKSGTKKICVSVDSEQELMDTYGMAIRDDLPCHLVTDSGLTEFNGIATKTCLAIGPALSSDIDKITGELKLL